MNAMAVGAAAATVGLVVIPAPLAARILLIAPLLIVPSLLHLATPALPRIGPVNMLAGWPALLAASPLVIAFSLSPGPTALALTLPWLALASTVAFAAVFDGLPRLRGPWHRGTVVDLVGDAALAFLAVGALFLLFDRRGLAPLGFAPSIVLVTAIHFHFAGFALLLVGTDLARRLESRGLAIAALGLAIGMPITAAAFLIDSSVVNAAGAALVVAGALGVASGLIRLRRAPLMAAGLILLLGVPFGLAWAAAPLLDTPFLEFDLMIRVHGALNTTGLVLVALFLARPK